MEFGLVDGGKGLAAFLSGLKRKIVVSHFVFSLQLSQLRLMVNEVEGLRANSVKHPPPPRLLKNCLRSKRKLLRLKDD